MMHTFKDNAGRTWTVAINVDAIKRVRDLAKVDLVESIEGKLLERLASDIILRCDVIYALIKPDADAQNVSDADFGRALFGDALDLATDALMEELVDFFPKRRRSVLGKALSKLTELESKALTLAEKKLDSVNVDAALESALANAGNSSG